MRKTDMQYFQNNQELMESYAHRKHTFEKIELRVDSEDSFAADLTKNKLLEIEERSKNGIWNLFKK